MRADRTQSRTVPRRSRTTARRRNGSLRTEPPPYSPHNAPPWSGRSGCAGQPNPAAVWRYSAPHAPAHTAHCRRSGHSPPRAGQRHFRSAMRYTRPRPSGVWQHPPPATQPFPHSAPCPKESRSRGRSRCFARSPARTGAPAHPPPAPHARGCPPLSHQCVRKARRCAA